MHSELGLNIENTTFFTGLSPEVVISLNAERDLIEELRYYNQHFANPHFDKHRWTQNTAANLRRMVVTEDELAELGSFLVPGDFQALNNAFYQRPDVSKPKRLSWKTSILTGACLATGVAFLLWESLRPTVHPMQVLDTQETKISVSSEKALPLFPMPLFEQQPESKKVVGTPNREFFVRVRENIWQSTEVALSRYCGVLPTNDQTVAVVKQILDQHGIYDEGIGIKSGREHQLSARNITEGIILVIDATNVPCPPIKMNSG